MTERKETTMGTKIEDLIAAEAKAAEEAELPATPMFRCLPTSRSLAVTHAPGTSRSASVRTSSTSHGVRRAARPACLDGGAFVVSKRSLRPTTSRPALDKLETDLAAVRRKALSA